jgi:hypothetical protein
MKNLQGMLVDSIMESSQLSLKFKMRILLQSKELANKIQMSEREFSETLQRPFQLQKIRKKEVTYLPNLLLEERIKVLQNTTMIQKLNQKQ